MWRNDVLKSAHRLSRHINTTRAGNLRLVRAINRRGTSLITRLLAPDNQLLIRMDGLTMYIYANSAETSLYLSGHFEPYTTELFRNAVQPGATVLDIGAQFGYYALLAAKQVGAEGRVHAFEPAPGNFKLLEQNIQKNGYSATIRGVPKAVGDRHTTVSLFVYEGSDSHGMFRHPLARVRQTISVECVTIDEFLDGQPADVIKMDIDGNEPYALEGMKQTISASDNLVLFAELAPAYLRRAGVEPGSYLDLLANLGFDLQLIDEDLHCLRPVTEDLIKEDDPQWYANLYCTKK